MIEFTKMHGLGNDFIVINSLTTQNDLSPSSIAKLSNRFIGIGFDQLLEIMPSDHADFYCRIYNSDGSEAEQCGNGLRCVARYLHEQEITSKKQFSIETKAGIFPVDIKDYDHIRVCMGTPHFSQEQLSYENVVGWAKRFSAQPNTPSSPAIIHDLDLDSPISILSLGNPHAVLKVHSLESLPIEDIAPQISSQPIFPNGVNVGFMQIINNHHIRLRTFERGAGETFACGSNATAAAASGIMQGWLESPVKVELMLGSLLIDWEGEGAAIFMTGPAANVFTGTIK